MRALRIHVPGDFEDAFLYMDQLVAIGSDRTLTWTNFGRLLDETLPPKLSSLGELFFRRNDLLAQDGTAMLLNDPSVRRLVRSTIGRNQDAFLAEPDTWWASGDYERLLSGATVLDLNIYNQRLYLGTTHGLVHADINPESDEELFLARPTKRTDARCLSIGIKYGTLAASCEDSGLLVGYDEFGEVESKPKSTNGLSEVANHSVRTSWLGYNLVNYVGAASAEGLKARYETVSDRGRRSVVVTDLVPQDRLVEQETRSWDGADFAFNDHATFFVHWPTNKFQLHRRTWVRGRLGREVDISEGDLERPLSAGSTLSGLVIETYAAIWLLADGRPEVLHQGEAIVVRTFPNSVRYRNLVVIVDDEGLHLISTFD